jgi:hypothetical protein
MLYLKQSTSATVVIGPFVDDTDGKTAETGLTISQADIRLSKNGGAFAQTNDATGASHMENGYYSVPLDATDTITLGRLTVAVSKSGALPVYREFQVVTANVYDTLCSTEKFDVNVAEISDDSVAADNAESFFDGTGYAGTNNVIPTVTTLTGHTAQTGDSYAIVNHADYGNAKLVRSTTPANTLTVNASNQVTVPDTQRVLLANSNDHGGATAGITLNGAAGLTSTTGITAGIVGNITGDLSGSVGSVAAGGINNASFNADVGTTAYVGNPIAVAAMKALDEYDPPTKAELDTAQGAVTLANGAHGGAAASITLADYSDFQGAAEDPWATALPGAYGAGTAGKIVGDNLNAAVGSIPTNPVLDTEDGSSFTAIPWNASWDAEVQSEVQDAIEVNNLDHLMKTAVANNADMTTEVPDGTVLSNIMSKTSDTSTFTVGDDSLEAIRDRGDAAWITATGFSTHTANNVRDAILSDSTAFAGANVDAAISSRSNHDAADVKTAVEAGGSHLALIKAVTDALTSASATKLSVSAGTMIPGEAAAGTLSTTEMTTNLTIGVDDQLNGRILIFAIDTVTAALRGQATDITDSTTVDGKLTFTALTTAPSAGDTFIIV